MLAMIDTAEAVEELKGAGASQKLASALVKLVASSNRVAIDQLATKDELKLESATLRTEIATAKTDIERSINASRNWTIGTQIAIASLVIAAIKFL